MINILEKQYSIQQVADLTGLSKQVIRKWEERYAIIRPQRLQNGYRIYGEHELQTLQNILHFSKKGYTTKQAIEIVKSKTDLPYTSSINASASFATQTLQNLIEAGQSGQETKLLHILQQAHHTIGVQEMIQTIIIPFLAQVGELWCKGVWTEFQEALSSLTIRDYLAHLRREFYVPSNAPLVLGSCLPNERHEIPLHLLLLQAMFKGYRTAMLGPSPAPTAIQSAVKELQPHIVMLSALTTLPFEDNLSFLQTLDAFALEHPHTTFYLGGPGIPIAIGEHPLQAIHITSCLEDIFE